MKVLVTGSRTWTDRKIIHEILHHLTEDDILVHGANGSYDRTTREWSGADVLCDQFAAVHSIPRRPYPVPDEEWKKYGLSAGPRRNQRMYDAEQPEQVFAFRMFGTSSGTDGMVKIALAGKTPVTLQYIGPAGGWHTYEPTDWADYCRFLNGNP